MIVVRSAPQEAVERLIRDNVPPLLARLYAARGITAPEQLERGLARLAAPERMLNLAQMARLLAEAISHQKRLLIIADYDADGATACAVGLRALRAFGAQVDYLVPDRFTFGYGLTPEIVRHAVDTKRPEVLITVDNGIASIDGVAEANRLGLKVLVTDHHLPGACLPDAWCIVNPNQPGCDFPSKHLAGVGVMFYLMLALRAELRQRGAFGQEPNLAELLPLVALGTVADVVKLDDNNRILVYQGLQRIRSGRMQPGLAALFHVAGRDPRRAGVYDLGFALAPRLNAAGRLADMSLGIECLSTDDAQRTVAIAGELDALNRERRLLEAGMQEAALAAVERIRFTETCTLSLFDPAWHQGVVGIVASRIKERFHRPTIAFARGADGEIRGSGRSIAGLHLRDLLDLIAKRHPDLLLKFGGHAAAAGLTLRERDFARFSAAFEDAAQSALTPEDLQRQLETDGSLDIADATVDSALLVRDQVWGHGFSEPRFYDRFEVRGQRIVGERHLKLRLARGERAFDAMLFGSTPTLPSRIEAVYRLDINDYNGTRTVQLSVEHWQVGAG
ncbi:MAG: single-stranded-DNA-specific exonuclease RecJ [Betaproteobacteria bacterium]|nr:single-stranded-DNA-specific exonuclease RecJ [Betaproteobacteria bacterium]